MWRRLYDERPAEGLTNKNLEFLRKVLTPGVWGRVLKLPMAMMAEARRQQHAPVRAAVIAQMAVAIAILAVAPVRLVNLTSIRLGSISRSRMGQIRTTGCISPQRTRKTTSDWSLCSRNTSRD